ncbi:hypothetical protein WI697_18885 [Tistrella mobilis]|uniref:hypothetical protein n=1 Tax=Tistrella mobilis TaxID=171437 RepID=UPI0031F71B09
MMMVDEALQTDAEDDLPAVLLDKISFGFSAAVGGIPEGAEERVAAALREGGLLRRASAPVSGHVTWEVRVPAEDTGGTPLDAVIACVIAPPVLRITSGSRFALPTLRLLRAHLLDEGEEVGDVALDGADNLVGPTADSAADLLRVQLELVRSAVDAFVEVLATAIINPALDHPPHADLAEHVLEERLWVRSLEVNRDHPVADAVVAVRALDRLPPPDARRISRDVYDNGGIAVRWKRTKKDEVKVYAKRPDLLRLEAVRRTRRDVAALTGHTSQEIGGEEAVNLLLHAARMAEGDLAWAEPHVWEALEAPFDPGELVARLLPIVRLAAGEKATPGTRGPRPRPDTVAGAQRALSDLLTTGRYWVPPKLATTALRDVLRQLSAGPNAPLAEQLTLYTVAPRSLTDKPEGAAP